MAYLSFNQKIFLSVQLACAILFCPLGSAVSQINNGHFNGNAEQMGAFQSEQLSVLAQKSSLHEDSHEDNIVSTNRVRSLHKTSANQSKSDGLNDATSTSKTQSGSASLDKCDKLHEDDLKFHGFRFLTNDLNFVDGRPVFSPDGKSIVFMRQPNNGDANARAELYIVPIYGEKKAKLLFDGINPKTGLPFNATRPDYSLCRSHFEIAFDAVSDGIWLLDVKTKKVRQVLEPTIDGNTYTWSYPAWYPCGKFLSVTNYNTFEKPLYHELVKVNVNELNQFTPTTKNDEVWAGQSSVSMKKSKWITFAGQVPSTQPPSPCDCIGGCLSDGYAQNCNQIWFQKEGVAHPIDDLQGRAPWFSTDGKYIVFESNRNNPEKPDHYSLFIYSIKHKTIMLVTPPALNVQHAKWSPHGNRIIFAVALYGGAQGIAIVELGKPFKSG